MLADYYDWTEATDESVAQLMFITGSPNQLYPYPSDALPKTISKGMPNIKDCYISGYFSPESVEGGVNAIGELLVTRLHEHSPTESGKAYVYLVAIDQENQPWFRGPYKPYGPHYYSLDSGIAFDELFGQIDLNKLSKKKL